MTSDEPNLTPPEKPRAHASLRGRTDASPTLHRMRFRSYEGVVVVESIAFDHLLPQGPHATALQEEHVLGVMTEPFN